MNAANFGPRLARILKQLDMTQAELAARSRITPAAVSMILDGKREPSLKSIVAILTVIPVKFETLVGDSK
jgi:transcriptional regulator with XRE-family HTH domain